MPFRPSYVSEVDEEAATEFYHNLKVVDPGARSHTHQPSATVLGDLVNEDNPPRHELILLGPGEKKLIEEVDTRVPNACIFTFNKEDHTLGNLLRARLLENPHILFSGYKVPHPLVPSFLLRVQTDGEISPKQALIAATTDLVSDLDNLSREFTKEFELVKMAQTTQNGD